MITIENLECVCVCVNVNVCLASTVAFLSIAQKRWYDNDPSLPNTHAQHALFHALDQVTLAHVGIICFVARETKGDRIKSY